jgi:REP element-mobilizing transposase RayT
MARKVRVQFPGAVYHVLDGEDRRENIFRGDFDCELFLDTLAQACERTGWRIYAWVLMSNQHSDDLWNSAIHGLPPLALTPLAPTSGW